MLDNRYNETDLATSTKVGEVCPYADPRSRSAFLEGYKAALVLESLRASRPLMLRMAKLQRQGWTEVRWRDVASGIPAALAQNTLQLLEADGFIELWLRRAHTTGSGRIGLYATFRKDLPTHSEYLAEVEAALQGSVVQEELAVGAGHPMRFFDPAASWSQMRLNPVEQAS